MLVDLLEKDAVPFHTLHTRYGPLLELGTSSSVCAQLRSVPRDLAAAFRTYNVMVPNLLNLPLLGWGLGLLDRRWVCRCMWPAEPWLRLLLGSLRSFALRRGASIDR